MQKIRLIKLEYLAVYGCTSMVNVLPEKVGQSSPNFLGILLHKIPNRDSQCARGATKKKGTQCIQHIKNMHNPHSTAQMHLLLAALQY